MTRSAVQSRPTASQTITYAYVPIPRSEHEEPLDTESLTTKMTAAIDHMIPLFGKTMRDLLAIHMKNFSKTGYPKGALGCSEKKIRSLLHDLFPDTSVYEKEIMRIAELVLCGCGDPELMIADVVNSPEDTKGALAALAPCLKLRSPVDPSDLPVPSPFSS